MLPFTKRPGRSDDSGSVVAKDEVPKPPRSVPPPKSIRPPAPSADEDEMTNIMQSRSMTGALVPDRPLPAAGRPATIPPRRPSIRPSSPPPPVMVSADDEDADDEDEGRTVVRPERSNRRGAKESAPKDLLQTAPTSINPTAVIKATVESARRREQLMPGPPADLLEDRADYTEDMSSARASAQRAPYVTSRSAPMFDAVPSHRGPTSHMPTSRPYAQPLGAQMAPMNVTPRQHLTPPGYPNHYTPVPQASGSVPGVASSVPAHFMTPQGPYPGDPPATAVTAGHKVHGRPALSWAAALLACGLFVGVAAVAVVQSSESVADTTASFVDPSRAPTKNNPQAAHAAAQPPPAANPLPPAPVTEPVAAAAPPGAAPPGAAPPGAAPPGAAPGAPPVAAAPPAVAFPPVTVTPPAPAAPPPVPPKVASKPAAPAWKAPAPPPPAPPPVAKAPSKPPPPPAEEEASSKKAPPATAKKGGKETDDETKKALEALQKAQLESASSF